MDSSVMLNVDLSSSTCRVCLHNREPSNSFEDMVQYGEEKLELREILFKVAASLDLNDSPTSGRIQQQSRRLQQQVTRVCEECTDKLFSAYDLLRMLERSERLLCEYLQGPDGPQKNEDIFHLDDIKEDIDVNVSEEESNHKIVPELDTQDMEVLEEEFEYSDHEGDTDSSCAAAGDTTDHQKMTQQRQRNQQRLQLELIPDNAVVIEELTDEQALCEEAVTTVVEENACGDVNVEEYLLCEYQTGKQDPEYRGLNTKGPPGRRERRLAIGSRLSTFETSKWHKCEQCKRSFAKIETLQNHVRLVHPPLPPEDLTETAYGGAAADMLSHIACPHCPRTFQRQENLNRHLMAIHTHTEAAHDADVAGWKKRVYKRGLCPYCGRSFSQASLAVHIRRHTGENPYKCSTKDCNKAFPRRQDLIIHERQHTGERPHVCSICGKSFMRPNKLARHLRIHTGHRPYKCGQCGKCFSQSNDLTIHLRRHSGDKPYRCGICGEGFICGTQLKTHRKQRAHFEPDVPAADPYAKCRVVNRGATPGGVLAFEDEDGDLVEAVLDDEEEEEVDEEQAV